MTEIPACTFLDKMFTIILTNERISALYYLKVVNYSWKGLVKS